MLCRDFGSETWEEARKRQDRTTLSSSHYRKESVKLIRHEVQVASLFYIFLEPSPEISPRWTHNLLTLSTDCRDCFQRCQPSWTFSCVMLWVSSCQSWKINWSPLILPVCLWLLIFVFRKENALLLYQTVMAPDNFNVYTTYIQKMSQITYTKKEVIF